MLLVLSAVDRDVSPEPAEARRKLDEPAGLAPPYVYPVRSTAEPCVAALRSESPKMVSPPPAETAPYASAGLLPWWLVGRPAAA